MNNPTDRAPRHFTGFLSHKATDAEAAAQIKAILESGLRNVTIFVSEETPSGDDWREHISANLIGADFLIFLFTNPSDDWSWCFYETGFFEAARSLRSRQAHASGDDERPIFCLHHPNVEPPSPLGNLQSVRSTEHGISRWIWRLRQITEQLPDEKETRITTQGICKVLASCRRGFKRTTIKPYITIRPVRPTSRKWDAAARDSAAWKNPPDNLDPERWLVDVDLESARMLGFTEALSDVRLLKFMRALESGHTGFRPLWLDTFLHSLDDAVKGSLDVQEVAYFRHRSGRILRPIIDSVLKGDDGTSQCRVIFVNAFSVPPSRNYGRLETLTDSIRLAIRSRTEILGVFAGNMASLHDKQWHRTQREDYNARKFPIGEQLLQSLHVIIQEAAAHDLRVEAAAPVLFAEEQQKEYERIRQDFTELWAQIQETARDEDESGFGRYDRTEALLADFAEISARYMDIAIPRLQYLLQEQMDDLAGRLRPAGSREGKRTTSSPDRLVKTVAPAVRAEPPAGLSRGYVDFLKKYWQGLYVCFRPTFANPEVVNAYLVEIRWDDERGYMVFEERARPDRMYEQRGEVHFHHGKPFVSLLTADEGGVRVIMLSTPIQGLARGLMLTLAHLADGPDFVPASTPVVLRRLDDGNTPQLGFVDSSSPDYAFYRNEILATMPKYGIFSNMVPAALSYGEDARPKAATRDAAQPHTSTVEPSAEPDSLVKH